MRLADLAEFGNWKSGKRRTLGAWSYYDCDVSDDCDGSTKGRSIYHYGTFMLALWERDGIVTVEAAELGWGSVSDQSGVNKVLAAVGADFRYKRSGGAHYAAL